MNKAGLFDVLRWWALGGYTMDGLYETGDQFKIAAGQSRFARNFFVEAQQTGNLSYSFNTTVTSLQDLGDHVVLNQTWTAKRVICAVPLNVIHKIRFEPALSDSKKAAILTLGNINHGAKVHLEVNGSDFRSWAGASWPVNRLGHGSGDSLTPAGNSHLVCFGSNNKHLTPEEDGREFLADCSRLHEMEVRKVVSPVT